MDLRTALLLALLLPAIGMPLPAASAGAQVPAPMLATRFGTGIGDLAGYLVSEKLDGVRARWDGKRLLTRNGDAIDAPAWFTADWPAQPMDGELWCGRGEFQRISDLVRALQRDDAQWRRVRFMAFDLPADGGGFGRRSARLRSLVLAADAPTLAVIAQTPIRGRAALDARLQAVVAGGGEGLVLHRADARYRAGRSDDLLKLKPYDDAEAVVVAHLPGKGRNAGRLGALEVQTPEGLRFALGSGFSDAQRDHPPQVGSTVTYRYVGINASGVPRFASFLRVRTE